MSCCLFFIKSNKYDIAEDHETRPKQDDFKQPPLNLIVESAERSSLVPSSLENEKSAATPISADDSSISFCLTPYATPNRPQPSSAYDKFSFLQMMMKHGVTLLKHDRKTAKSTNNVFKISSNGTKLLWFPVEKRISMKGASDRELPLSELLEAREFRTNILIHRFISLVGNRRTYSGDCSEERPRQYSKIFFVSNICRKKFGNICAVGRNIFKPLERILCICPQK